MQISLTKFFIGFIAINVLVWATFVLPPNASYIFFSVISAFVLPPFIIVGVVNTRGIRQAFFLGAMVSGMGHYIFCVYLAILLVFGEAYPVYETTDGDWGYAIFIHQIFIGLGALGGLMGMASYKFLGLSKGNSETEQEAVAHDINIESVNAMETTPTTEGAIRLPR